MKKFVAIMLCLVLLLLGGCGSEGRVSSTETIPTLNTAEQAEVDKCIKEHGRAAIVHYLQNLDTKNTDEERALKYLEHFVSQGAEVNMKTAGDVTPLHFAAAQGYVNVVKFLVSQGADAAILEPRHTVEKVTPRQLEDPDIIKLPPIPQNKTPKFEPVTIPFGKPEGEKYRVQDVDPNDPSITSGFSCEVYVRIKKSDETAFNKIYEPRAKEVNQLVQTILRQSDLAERTESSLRVIRNRINRRATEELDIPYILDIIITEFQTESM